MALKGLTDILVVKSAWTASDRRGDGTHSHYAVRQGRSDLKR